MVKITSRLSSPNAFIPSTHPVRTGTGHISPDEIRQLEGVCAVLPYWPQREVQLAKTPLQKRLLWAALQPDFPSLSAMSF